jgi:hypothetical protein
VTRTFYGEPIDERGGKDFESVRRQKWLRDQQPITVWVVLCYWSSVAGVIFALFKWALIPLFHKTLEILR